MERRATVFPEASAANIQLISNIKRIILSSGLVLDEDADDVDHHWTPILPCQDSMPSQILTIGMISVGAVAIGKTLNSNAVKIGGPLICTSTMVVHKIWTKWQTSCYTKSVAEWITLIQKMMEVANFIIDYIQKRSRTFKFVCRPTVNIPEWCSIEMAKNHLQFLFEYCMVLLAALNQLCSLLNVSQNTYNFDESLWDKYKGEDVTDLSDYFKDYQMLRNYCHLLHSKMVVIFLMGLLDSVDKNVFHKILNKWLPQYLKATRKIVSNASKQLDAFKFILHSQHEDTFLKPQEKNCGINKSFEDYFILLQEQFDMLNILHKESSKESKKDMSKLLTRMHTNHITEGTLLLIIEKRLSKSAFTNEQTSQPVINRTPLIEDNLHPTIFHDEPVEEYSSEEFELSIHDSDPPETTSVYTFDEDESNANAYRRTLMQELCATLKGRTQSKRGDQKIMDEKKETVDIAVTSKGKPTLMDPQETNIVDELLNGVKLASIDNEVVSNKGADFVPPAPSYMPPPLPPPPPVMQFNLDAERVDTLPTLALCDSLALAAAQFNRTEEYFADDDDDGH